ncbi:hypothetical protein N7457_007022 [Penicillium paradoxum]|uniref:uncharacterized protein n=1 Tax=Penicillium paradoxum TaxID=176176 RepID=UPI002547BFEF|nr:uncharacterized protein N7457_007022 [Penicillium paradoxum]KAJ5779302.1 hypothetical protein N7457_007022 [Penicillium paradoxum]
MASKLYAGITRLDRSYDGASPAAQGLAICYGEKRLLSKTLATCVVTRHQFRSSGGGIQAWIRTYQGSPKKDEARTDTEATIFDQDME